MRLIATEILFVNAAAGIWPGDEEEKPNKPRRKRKPKQETPDNSEEPKSGRGN